MSLAIFFYRLVKIEDYMALDCLKITKNRSLVRTLKCTEDEGIGMKTAQELRVGNVFMIDNQAMVVLKSEYNKSGLLCCSKVRRKISTGSVSEFAKADDKFEVLILDGNVSFSYFSDPLMFFG